VVGEAADNKDSVSRRLDTRDSLSISSQDMAAIKTERFLSSLQISDPLGGFPPPHSPLDSYHKLEELHLLLQSAAAGNSFLAAAPDGLTGFLSGESGEGDRQCGGKVILRACS